MVTSPLIHQTPAPLASTSGLVDLVDPLKTKLVHTQKNSGDQPLEVISTHVGASTHNPGKPPTPSLSNS